MSKHQEFKKGNIVVNKEGKLGCIFKDSPEDESHIVVAFIESDQASIHIYPKTDFSIARCEDKEHNSRYCDYEGPNAFDKELNCTICRIKRKLK